MIGNRAPFKPGPFQIVESEGTGNVDAPIAPPRRRHQCPNYSKCLSLAAALNWDNFTCRGCSAEINQSLLWRAHQAKRRDKVVRELCDLPEITSLSSESGSQDIIKIAHK